MKSKYSRFLIVTAIVTVFIPVGRTLAQVKWVESTNAKTWIIKDTKPANAKKAVADVTVLVDQKEQTIEGFGACFNELGWTALSVLDDQGRESILKNLFDPVDGLKLNICRMPIGANDYARDYYSLNDSVNDFGMKYFSIERDKGTLIPYIKAAMKYKPDLKVWGSPWCPPSWMKTNNHYACRPGSNNGLTAGQTGKDFEHNLLSKSIAGIILDSFPARIGILSHFGKHPTGRKVGDGGILNIRAIRQQANIPFGFHVSHLGA